MAKEDFLKEIDFLTRPLNRNMVFQFPKEEMKEGDILLIDFNNHYVGQVRLEISTTGNHPDAPALLRLRFLENKREIEENEDEYKGWISKSWIQSEQIHIDYFPAEANLERRYAFRYLEIKVLGLSNNYSLVIDEVNLEETTSADDNQLEKFNGNEIENKIDKISLRTLKNCMQEVFEDGPKRDRRLWLGDLRLQALANYYTYKNYDLVKKCLYIFAYTCDSKGRMPACAYLKPEIEADEAHLLDYSLLFIPTLYEYTVYSSDLDTAKSLYQTALNQFLLADEYFKADVICVPDNPVWCFMDWNFTLDKQAGAQFVYIYAGKYLLRLMDILNDYSDKNLVEEKINARLQKAKDIFYDEGNKVFVSGKDKQVSVINQIWAVLAGAIDKEEGKELLSKCLKENDMVKLVTPYAYHYFIEALLKADMKDEAYEVMISYWKAMADDGADTFYELFDPENPESSPYGSYTVNSYCHAWSCTPSYYLRSNAFKKYKGIIFDLDGVICFTDEYHYKAWKKLADEYGIYFDKEINNRLRGVSRRESLDIILEKYKGPELSNEEKEEMCNKKNELYRESLMNMSPSDLSEEVKETLDYLKNKGYKLAIGSSSKNTPLILEKIGLKDFFDAVSDGNNITKSKPDPEVFVKASKMINLNPGECLVVEDAVSGAQAGHNGNFKVACVGDAAKEKAGDYNLTSFKDILNILE